MKKRFLISLVLFLMLIVSMVYGGKPVKPPEPEYDCYEWRFTASCDLVNDGAWNFADYGGPYNDYEGDGLNNLKECREGSKPYYDDSDFDGYKDGIIIYSISDGCIIQENYLYNSKDAKPRDARTPGYQKNKVCKFKDYTEDQVKSFLECLKYKSPYIFSDADINNMCEILNDESNQFLRHLTALLLRICQGGICEECAVSIDFMPNVHTVKQLIEQCTSIYLDPYSNPKDIEDCWLAFDLLNNDMTNSGFATEDTMEEGFLCIECPEDDNMASTTGYATKSTTQNTSPWSKFMNWVLSFF